MAGLYLHIPFCKQACYYCDFHFSVNTSIKADLVRAIIKELEMQAHYLAGEPLDTLYFGGGTPSLLTDDELNAILNAIGKRYSVSADPEITLEANPDDLTREKLAALAGAGINRLSIGVQSFDNHVLKFLNRAHTAIEAEQCIEAAHQAGISNLSIDIMFGLPNQHEFILRKDLAKALTLQPAHNSVYSLTVEEKTVFGKWAQQGKLKITDEPEAAQQFEVVMDTLESNGFIQYEISNYAKPGFESRHNSSYWQRKKYLGIGPSAHSYNGNTRQFNVRNNYHYVQALNTGKIPYEIEQLTLANKINEYIFTSLRTNIGCSLAVLKRDYDYDLTALPGNPLLKMANQNLITLKADTVLLTRAGKLVADQLAMEFFASEK
ncbi:MAG TPA: radical SAM family heme chaperone HemW [Cyclobacteriaceae bacterium]|nr:radical SAM family heme chaperone HemW [Cyclobacteriaceae bacterium]